MSNKNFLHTIVAPNLTDSNFGQSIQTQFDNINTNFQRLVSAAYLSGQDGNDVVVKDVPIYTEKITVLDRTTNEVKVYDTIDVINEFLNVGDINYEFVIADGQENKYEFLYDILQQAVFTDFGLQLVETIFSEQFELTYHRLTSIVNGIETVHSELGYVLFNEDLEYRYPSYSDTDKYPVWLAFVYSPFVRMFAIHDIDTDTITNICATQLYYFYDARIGSVQLLDDKYSANDFTDYTSFITISSERNADGDYEINGTYTMFKSQDLPTLYYDNDAQEFCWKMNGIETNITAQGVKGDKGEPAGCWFCRGVATTVQENNDPMISVRLISYYTTDETGTIILRSVNDENCEIKNGDFVCVDVYNSDATNNTTYFDTIFGNVNVYTQTTGDSSQLVYNVTRPYYASLISIIKNSPVILCEQLRRIDGYGIDDKLHGIFLPSKDKTYSHMINVSSVKPYDTLILHPVANDDVIGNILKSEPTTLDNINEPEILIDGYKVVTINSDTSVKNFDADTITSRGIVTGKVGGINGVNLGVPIGIIVDYYTPNGVDVPEGWFPIDDSDDFIYSDNMSSIAPFEFELMTFDDSVQFTNVFDLRVFNVITREYTYFKLTDLKMKNLFNCISTAVMFNSKTTPVTNYIGNVDFDYLETTILMPYIDEDINYSFGWPERYLTSKSTNDLTNKTTYNLYLKH